MTPTAVASFNLQLTADHTGVLAVNGTAAILNSSTAGRNASYTFGFVDWSGVVLFSFSIRFPC
ncbi:hypothetical protein AWB69_07126 [Caballeronia udeis]|uniref:Uncharacterized protein n=1 Tax=Caballeronia udeis TaxID=1232866 RepID=A0A158J573_9BURK|nr:hypothetical protein AWB69_07126 [Caballeronia udeis]